MRYLVFDIECCDGHHICEFGYVIVNEQFEILEKRVLTINPDKPFKFPDRKNREPITLFFSEDIYVCSPQFPAYYDKIKSLIEAPDQIVIGHAISNDAKFLNTACIRYQLEPIDFSFVDTQRIYSEFAEEKENISLKTAEDLFNLEKSQYIHKSDDDALLTMRFLCGMCQTLELSLNDIMEKHPMVCGKNIGGNVNYVGDTINEMLEIIDKDNNAISMKQREVFLGRFAAAVQPDEKIVKSKLNGKKLCLSVFFEKNMYRDLLVIVRLLANHVCSYNTRVSENDFYVTTFEEFEDEDVKDDKRYVIAKRLKAKGSIRIMTLRELLKILGVTMDVVAEMDMPSVDDEIVMKSYHSVGTMTTLGDKFKELGIDLSKFFDE